MKKIYLLFAFLTLFSHGARADSTQNAAQLIDQGDRLFAARTESAGAPQALAYYIQAASAAPSAATPLWKAARACYWIGDHSKIKKEKIIAFEQGISFSEKAVQLDPSSPDAHFWLGGLYGSYGEVKGILKSLSLLKPIRKEMETLIKLNDRFQGGAGYRVLGIVDYKVPGFAGGDKKRALQELSKALAIDSGNAFNQFYMAEYLATAAGNKSGAREHLDAIRLLTPTADVDAADLKLVSGKADALRAQIGK